MTLKAFQYQELFDRFAPGYPIVDILSFGLSNYLRKQAINKALLSDSGFIIDLMCGTGNNAKLLKAKLRGRLSYVGVDISGGMIKDARNRYKKFDSAQFIQTDIFNLNSNRKADYVLCSYGLKCIDNSEYTAFVELINHVTADNGTFSIVEFQLPDSVVLEFFFKMYLNTVYRLGCLFSIGSSLPMKALLQEIANPIDLNLLKKKFQEKGIEVEVEQKWMKAILIISGRKAIHTKGE